MTEESTHAHKPTDDVAELIDWHTPETPAWPPSRQGRPAEDDSSGGEGQ